ncbi:MAG: DUF3467 domain-containing protein [Candidatus Poribacteria bacterium]
MEEQNKEAQIERIKTIYSNIVRIGHTPYEFLLDFGQFQPEGKNAFMDVRIITSPQHAKAILKALRDNIAIFEEKYGKINIETDQENGKDSDQNWDQRRKS